MDAFRNQLTPRRLSLIILVLGLSLAMILFFPIAQVFSGQWKLNQQIELFYLEYIGFGDWQIPLGTISIRYYAICILLGVILGYILSLYLSKAHYIASTIIDRLVIGLLVFGLIGARLFFVLFNWESFVRNPLNIILGLPQGGLAIFGSMIVGFIYIWLYCKQFRFNFWEFMDFLAPGILLGQVIGRFGNFFNYEAYGPATSAYWKMYVPDTANFYADLNIKYFHPTFLYEIIPNFLLLVLLLFKYQRWTQKSAGLIFAWYCMGYGLIRFFVELYRLDALKIPLPFTIPFGIFSINAILVSQLAALLMFIFGILIHNKRRKVVYLKKTMAEYYM